MLTSLFLWQTNFDGYATPCDDWICWYDSSMNLVAALDPAAAATGKAISFQSIPETGLVPCTTNSAAPCRWYMTLQANGAVNALYIPASKVVTFAANASWNVVAAANGNASQVSYTNVASPSLYLSAGAAAPGSAVAGTRLLQALPLTLLSNNNQASWELLPANILKCTSPSICPYKNNKKFPVPLPPTGSGGWHSLRLAAQLAVPVDLMTSTMGNLSTLAAVNNTQTLTGLALDSGLLSPEDQLAAASVLLNDLLSGAEFCGIFPGASPGGSGCIVRRGHQTGGMVGIKASLDALQLLGRSTELLEALTLSDFPSLGNMIEGGASALWSDWGDRADATGTYHSGANVCADGCAESFAAAWLSLAVKYYWTVFSGIGQADNSSGYATLILSPNVPWADANTGLSVGGAARSLDSVTSSKETPRGRVTSSFARRFSANSNEAEFEFVVPPNGTATLVVPITIGRSNITIRDLNSGSLVYTSHGGFVADRATTGLASRGGDAFTVVGSYIAAQMTAAPGRYRLLVTGSSPAVPVCTTASFGLQCPPGMRIASIEQAAFGNIARAPATCGAKAVIECAAGSSRWHVERLCLGKASCQIPWERQLFDPAGQAGICRGREGGGGARARQAELGAAPTVYAQALCARM